MEIFIKINGFKNYMISNKGNVFSKNTMSIMKPEKTRVGYLRIQLSDNGITKKFLIHRLVASAFMNPSTNNTEINHIDENKENNCVKNLEWCTHSENMKRGTVQRRRMLNIDIKKYYKKVQRQSLNDGEIKIYDKLTSVKLDGFSSGLVSQCCNNKYGSKHNIYRGFKWSFVNTK